MSFEQDIVYAMMDAHYEQMCAKGFVTSRLETSMQITGILTMAMDLHGIERMRATQAELHKLVDEIAQAQEEKK